MKQLLATVLGLGVLIVFGLTADAQQSYTVKSGSWIGCTTKEVKSELTGYLVDNDRAAFESAASRYILAGQCTIFKTGETVHLADTSFFSGLVKIRRRGETKAYWTNTEAI